MKEEPMRLAGIVVVREYQQDMEVSLMKLCDAVKNDWYSSGLLREEDRENLLGEQDEAFERVTGSIFIEWNSNNEELLSVLQAVRGRNTKVLNFHKITAASIWRVLSCGAEPS